MGLLNWLTRSRGKKLELQKLELQIEIGSKWLFSTDDPFFSDKTLKVINIIDDYVQYEYTHQAGYYKWSDTKEGFLQHFKPLGISNDK